MRLELLAMVSQQQMPYLSSNNADSISFANFSSIPSRSYKGNKRSTSHYSIHLLTNTLLLHVYLENSSFLQWYEKIIKGWSGCTKSYKPFYADTSSRRLLLLTWTLKNFWGYCKLLASVVIFLVTKIRIPEHMVQRKHILHEIEFQKDHLIEMTRSCDVETNHFLHVWLKTKKQEDAVYHNSLVLSIYCILRRHHLLA